MDFADLKGMVETTLQETYFNQISGDLINEIYREAHEELLFPGLKTAGTVTITTDSYSVQVPSDYGGPATLFFKDGYTPSIRLLGLEELLENYPKLLSLSPGGAYPTEYAIEDKTIYFAPAYTGTADLTMNIVYYKDLPLLSCDNDEPEFIPDFLRKGVLVNGALFKAYTYLERDEQMKPNSTAYLHFYTTNMEKLHTYYTNRRYLKIKANWI